MFHQESEHYKIFETVPVWEMPKEQGWYNLVWNNPEAPAHPEACGRVWFTGKEFNWHLASNVTNLVDGPLFWLRETEPALSADALIWCMMNEMDKAGIDQTDFPDYNEDTDFAAAMVRFMVAKIEEARKGMSTTEDNAQQNIGVLHLFNGKCAGLDFQLEVRLPAPVRVGEGFFPSDFEEHLRDGTGSALSKEFDSEPGFVVETVSWCKGIERGTYLLVEIKER